MRAVSILAAATRCSVVLTGHVQSMDGRLGGVRQKQANGPQCVDVVLGLHRAKRRHHLPGSLDAERAICRSISRA